MPGLGFIDTVHGPQDLAHPQYGAMTAISNQYAAMPSLHFGWSLWCGIVIIVLAPKGRQKLLGALHPLITVCAIVATANHWVLDAVGGAVVVSAGFGLVYVLSGPRGLRLSLPAPRRGDAGRGPEQPAVAASGATAGVTCLINEERRRLGLPELSDSAKLREAANKHVTAALAQKWWGNGNDPHQNPQVSGTGQEQIVRRIQDERYCPNGTWAGYEITYNGWGPGSGTPRAAVNWWLHVSTWGHAEIIRDPSLTEFGIAPRGGAADPAGAGFDDAGTYVVELGRCER